MKVGRNDPCPCGSGKKYRNCHMEEDHQALAVETSFFGTSRDFDDDELDFAALDLGDADLDFDDELGISAEELSALMTAAAAQDTWQADLVPLPTRIEDDPAARPAALLVTSGPIPLHIEVLGYPPAEPGEVARVLEQGVQAALQQTGQAPSRLEVRHAEVARYLGKALGGRGIEVITAPTLPMLDMLIQAMIGHLGSIQDTIPLSAPETWEEWGLPREQIAEIFRAAAAFYRAEPWRHLTNLQLLHATLPEGGSWAACVLGNGGEQFGLVLYADVADFVRQIETDDPAESFLALQGPVVSLTFEQRNDLPRPMQKEIAASGWDVASPRAYPLLITFNTPGGSISREQARELTDLLRSIPRFTAEFEAVFSGQEEAELPLEWRDPDTGITLLYRGFLIPHQTGIWDLPEELSPATTEGPGAQPEAALEVQDPEPLREEGMKLVERFEKSLRKRKLKEATVERHLSNSEIFLEFLSGYQGIPLAAVTEYDLRVFLYDWFPRKVATSRTHALGVPTSLRRFFAHLAAREGISCPWADAILLDKDSFELRHDEFPGGFWWDEEVQDWQTELYDDLDARIMLPDRGMAGGGTWGPTMGFEEAQLERELQRRWLLWRDEVIRSGVTDPEAVRAALVPRQREWEKTPHPSLGGRTPVQAIAAERREQEKQERRGGRKRGR